jgi:peptide-methionine (S)-S-oxide reductase
VLKGFACFLGALLLFISSPVQAAPINEAVLAGGCFWCLEHDLEKLPGVLDVQSGYAGGDKPNPTYQEVSAGGTNYVESVKVRFDPNKLSYESLLRSFWRNVDPTDGSGQFCDRGSSYRPVIFVADADQKKGAEASAAAAKAELGSKKVLRVAIEPLKRFWPAENYHQNYAELNKAKYNFYRWSCGRDARLDAVWGKKARKGLMWSSLPLKPGGQR